MALEWKQKCKDCGKEFGYSDISLQRDLRKGLSRAERCDDCRKQHASEIKSIASSHFALKPRKSKPSILGYPFLGQIEHGERVLKEFYKKADNTGMDVGLKDHHIKQIYEALEQNQVLVIVAPTGTGKSTFLPSKFIDPLPDYPIDYFTKKGPIIVTQPRIPAARDIPKTIGNKLVGSSVGAGYDIGFRHGDRSGKRRGDNYDKKRNRLIFVTDGSLINWLEEGQIADFSMIIVDEAHERSCNIDLILGLAKRELLKYPHLKFIIASATIDAESFVNYFSSSTTVKQFDFSDCQKSFGYEEFPWKLSELRKEDLEDAVVEKNKDAAKAELKKYERTIASTLANKIVELINTTDKGGIVGFLHGEEHINRAVKLVTDKLKGRRDVKVFPLYTGV
ncbi:MAG: DEAD/DEAH box helicase, partial [bacterium]